MNWDDITQSQQYQDADDYQREVFPQRFCYSNHQRLPAGRSAVGGNSVKSLTG